MVMRIAARLWRSPNHLPRRPGNTELTTGSPAVFFANWCEWLELNQRPWAYETPILPLNYTREIGGGGGDRTHDLRFKRPLLLPLSYTPKIQSL